MTGPVTTEALRDALASRIDSHFERFPSGFWTGEYIAGNLMRSVLAPLLAAHQQVTAERDEETQRANEAVIRAGAMEQERNHLRLHFDAAIAAATNDELPSNIRKTLAERVTWYRERWQWSTSELARLRAEGEAKDRALDAFASMLSDREELAHDALQVGGLVPLDPEFEVEVPLSLLYAARTALTRSATAKEG